MTNNYNIDKSAFYSDVAVNSNIISGDEFRSMICAIAQLAADMVSKTLGPYGSTTVIDDGSGFTYPTKDGWSCLNKLQFTDPTYNTIYNMLKRISFNSATTVGDGTTTAMVAANNFLSDMYENFIPTIMDTHEGGFRQADFINTMHDILDDVIHDLQTNSNIKHIDVSTEVDSIRKIAYIATNGNNQFADIIANIYKETGNPYINIGIDNIPETTYSIQKGYRFDVSVLNYSAYAINGIIDNTNEPQNIIIFDHNVSYQSHKDIIAAIANYTNTTGTSSIILAPYFDDIVVALIDGTVQQLVQNKQRPNLMLGQIPVTMQSHKQTLYDMAIITNGRVITDAKVKAFNILLHNQSHDVDHQVDTSMLDIEEFAFAQPADIITQSIGKTQSLIIDKSDGFISDYESIANPQYYQNIVKESEEVFKELRDKATKTIGGLLDKEYLYAQMRYVKLKGVTGTITVGGVSDIQQRCDKDSLDDAILACRSAFENGYVRGMNLELLSILNNKKKSHSLDKGMYYSDICNLLYIAIYNTALEVMYNKYPKCKYYGDNASREVKMPAGTDAMRSNSETITTSLTNTEILNILINDKSIMDYDLRTETMHDRDNWEVINSTATDIEIIKAIVNVLSTVITSSQYLSTTRRFDTRIHDERTLKQQLIDDSRIVENKVNAAINALTNHSKFKIGKAISRFMSEDTK